LEKNKVIKSLAFKFSERIAVKGIGLLIQVLLARMLAPEAFGQLAVLMVFINLSQNFIQSGFNTALVQNKDVTEVDYSTVYYISTAIALLCNVVLFIAAPFIGGFYEAPELVLPLRVFAVVLFFGAFNSVQVARLQKEMRFKETMICNLIATIVSGIAGVVCAYAGLGIWALIIYNMSNVVISSIVMMFCVRWRPRLIFSMQRAKVLFGFGWKMLVSSFLCSIYHDLRSLIIGKKFSTEDLAYYNRGQQFPYIISNTLDEAVQSVMFPTLSGIQDDREKLQKVLSKSLTLGTFIIVPAMVGLAGISESFIRFVLTDAWLPAVPYMVVLSLLEIGNPYISTNLVAIKSIGRSDVYMKMEIIRRIIMTAILAVSVFCFNSVMAIAIAATITYWVDAFVTMIPVQKLVGYGIIAQLKDTWKNLLCSALMGGVVILVGMLSIHPALLMLLQMAIGALAYVLFTWLINRKMFDYIIATARGFLKKAH